MHPVADRLLRAAQWLEDHEWAQRVYGLRGNGSEYDPYSADLGAFLEEDEASPIVACCALGACALSGPSGPILAASREAATVAYVLARSLGMEPLFDLDVPFDHGEVWEESMNFVAQWNDDRSRTKEEVVAALRAAACELQDASACKER